MALVQSKGKSILFDSGGPSDRTSLLNALLNQGLHLPPPPLALS